MGHKKADLKWTAFAFRQRLKKGLIAYGERDQGGIKMPA